ncbi:MAG TPA: M50 family metallopeptidase [Virgibacillus sp.]|nr:M50 family metallopeptidase [Virgibacillus sp.]
MTIRKFIPPIHVHPLLMIFMIISFLTGTFMELSIILAIVLFHELGHFLFARLFHWRIHSIMLWVFGGVMKTEEHGNKPIHEDALVTIAGPLQHIIIYVGLFVLSTNNVLPESVYDLVLYYNTTILIFNLLPIWPLDGGKFLFICLSAMLPYRKAYHSIMIISMCTSLALLCTQLFVYPFTLSTFLIMIFIFMENRTEWKQRFYVFIRFLLNRYQGKNSIYKIEPIKVSHDSSMMDVFSQFKRDRKHSISVVYSADKSKQIDETDCLRGYFYEQQYNKTIGQYIERHPE